MGAPHPRDGGFAHPPRDHHTQAPRGSDRSFLLKNAGPGAQRTNIYSSLQMYKTQTERKPEAQELGGWRGPPRAPYKNKGRLCWGAQLCTGSWPPPQCRGAQPHIGSTPPPRALLPPAQKFPFLSPFHILAAVGGSRKGGRGCAPPRRSLPTSPARAGPRGAPSPPAPRLLCFYLESSDKPAAPPRPQRSRSELAIR